LESNRSFKENNEEFRKLKDKLINSKVNLVGAKGRNSAAFGSLFDKSQKTESVEIPL
jgi:hypothetical protein